jgi:UDP-glucose/GDP-mannose dehydrogenase family, UDP binding domain
MGLSYKPNTEVIEESQGLALAKYLLSVGVPVVVYDPAAMENARPLLAGMVTFATSAADCARQADVLAIATLWAEFREVSPKDFKPHGTVLDCWTAAGQGCGRGCTGVRGAAIRHWKRGIGLSCAFQGCLSYWSRSGLSQVKMEQIDFVWSGAKRSDTFEPGIRIRVCRLPGRLQVEVGLHRDDVRRRYARIPRFST